MNNTTVSVKVLGVIVTPEQHQWMKDYAVLTGKSISEIVGELLTTLSDFPH